MKHFFPSFFFIMFITVPRFKSSSFAMRLADAFGLPPKMLFTLFTFATVVVVVGRANKKGRKALAAAAMFYRITDWLPLQRSSAAGRTAKN